MPQLQIKKFILKLFEQLQKHHYADKFIVKPLKKILQFLSSWWQILILSIFAFLFLYYPIGGLIVNNIDDNTQYEINSSENGQSATFEMMSFLIRRETKDKIWTPSLPFFFPSYFLDNMPNFQLGMMSSIRNVASTMSKSLQKTIKTGEESHLKEAATLLKYPGTIWMFSPQNKLVPVPSATTQYNRARKQLIAYNQQLREGSEVFYKSPYDLARILKQINKDMLHSNDIIASHIRENSTNWFDAKADNIYYYQKGKLYGYYLLLKALGSDYKDIIVSQDLYNSWTLLLKSLENASKINPLIIRNATLDSSFSPNHLSYIAYYTLKAASINQTIIRRLETPATKE